MEDETWLRQVRFAEEYSWNYSIFYFHCLFSCRYKSLVSLIISPHQSVCSPWTPLVRGVPRLLFLQDRNLEIHLSIVLWEAGRMLWYLMTAGEMGRLQTFSAAAATAGLSWQQTSQFTLQPIRAESAMSRKLSTAGWLPRRPHMHQIILETAHFWQLGVKESSKFLPYQAFVFSSFHPWLCLLT